MSSETREIIEDLIGAIERHADEQLLLVTGFDGVLIEYRVDPEAVRLSPTLRQLLLTLRQRRDVVLAIISGRRVADLKPRTRLDDDVFYVGLHGLEIEGPGFTRIDRAAVDSHPHPVHAIAATLQESLMSVAGIRIEDKDAAVAVHTREASPVDAVWARIHLLNAAADLVNSQELRVVRGNHVFELVPNVEHPRAVAIEAIRRHLEARRQRRVFTVYIGEDLVEDDAFGAVQGRGLVAVVGRRAPRADYHLGSPAVVRRLIARLTRITAGRSSHRRSDGRPH